MPAFNPSVPDMNDPNWLGWSKAIQQPEGDKSKGVLFSSIGDILEQGLKSADKVVESKVKSDVETQLQPKIEEHIGALTGATDALIEGRPLTQQDLLDKDKANNPTEVDAAIRKGEMLTKRRANGKSSDTEYWKDIYTLQKSIRSQYPGYRDVVDREFERITGANSANKLLSNLIQDYNSFQTNGQKEHDQVTVMFNKLIEEGRYRQTGPVGPTGPSPLRTILASDDAAQFAAGQIDINEAKRRLNFYKLPEMEVHALKTKVEGQELEKQDITPYAKSMAEKALNPLRDKIAEQLAPFEAQSKAMVDAISSGKVPDPEKAQQMLYQLDHLRTAAQAEFRQFVYSNNPDEKLKGHNVAWYFKDKKELDDFESRYLEPLDSIINNFKAGDTGFVHYAAKTAQVINDRDKVDILKDEQMGPNIRLKQATKDAGPVFNKMVDDEIEKKNASGPLKTWVGIQLMKWGTGDPGASIADSVSAARNSKDLSPGDKAIAIDKLIDGAVMITNPSMEEGPRTNMLKSIIDPTKNLQLFKDFKPGAAQEKYYNALTSPAFSKAVKELDSKSPGLMNAYKQFVFSSTAIVFNNEFQKIRDLEGISGRVGWNDGKDNGGYPRFEINIPPVSDVPVERRSSRGMDVIRGEARQRLADEERNIVDAFLNPALRNMADIAKANNEDPNSFILQAMKTLKTVNPETMQGLPREFYDAVAKHREAAQKYEEQKKAMTARPKKEQ
jgi:hypothetical protein